MFLREERADGMVLSSPCTSRSCCWKADRLVLDRMIWLRYVCSDPNVSITDRRRYGQSPGTRRGIQWEPERCGMERKREKGGEERPQKIST